jgi:uncharacterized damage-inducible protein DinB|tara:strand:- start:145 stop:1284 length:1140 start_codon:yes stop_codon:yes gene_type:complete
MKKIIFLFLVITISKQSISQENKSSKEWTSFVQSINISIDTEKKFKLVANVKLESTEKAATAHLWARVDTKNGEPGFFDNMADRPITNNKWMEYSIEGKINKYSKTLNFGGLCIYDGNFFFDNFRLYLEDDKGDLKEVEILNNSFESEIKNNIIKNWDESISANNTVRAINFTVKSSKDSFHNKKSLLIIGRGNKVDEGDYGKIGIDDAENPQIENMISMLNDLKGRVESAVRDLKQNQTDHLHDEKANRIGALVIHLASAEVYYQNFTFGEKVFKDDKFKDWDTALDLSEKGRELFKNKPISYYLELFDKVREKTIEELRKRDDKWFRTTNAGRGISNQYAWFHVMEHQSSHLGQILFLKKRLPKFNNEIKVKNKPKN